MIEQQNCGLEKLFIGGARQVQLFSETEANVKLEFKIKICRENCGPPGVLQHQFRPEDDKARVVLLVLM